MYISSFASQKLLTMSKTKKAHTLIEILVTVILFSIGILGIFSVFTFMTRNTTISENKLLAANKGKELLEDLRAKIDTRTWDTPTPSWDLTCDNTSHNWPDNIQFKGDPIKYVCVEDDPIAGVRKVTLTVTWTDIVTGTGI